MVKDTVKYSAIVTITSLLLLANTLPVAAAPASDKPLSDRKKNSGTDYVVLDHPFKPTKGPYLDGTLTYYEDPGSDDPVDDDVDDDGFTVPLDCNDSDPSIHPDASEIPYDGVDNDCTASTLDNDLDEDGYLLADDCNDINPNVHPGADEIPYDGFNNDCDPTTPENDLDRDGYVLINDCNDINASVHPGASEIADDGIDQDCDGVDLEEEEDVTSLMCWEAVPFQIQNYAIDWSSATTVATNWDSGLNWVDTDLVQVLDASSSSNLVNFYTSCGGAYEETLYLPDGYTMPALGEEYNNGIAVILQPDGTVYEVNYIQDCGDGSWSGYVLPDYSPADACSAGLEPARWIGAHGGSHITATQALRLGELTGSDPIGRPLPVEIDHTHLYYGSDGYRWPAASADSYASALYTGTNTQLQMGSILVLPESYDCTALSTTPGERLCEVARDYGLIVVDDSYGTNEVAFPIELAAETEVQTDLGYSLHNSQSRPFGSDVETMFADMLVLTNPTGPTPAWVL